MDLKFRPLALSELKFSETTEAALRSDLPTARKLAGIARDLHDLRARARAQQSELLSYYTDKDGCKLGAAEKEKLSSSRAALENERTPAAVLLIAARNILGPGMAAYEPETIRTELEDREGLTIPPVNFDKLLSAITLVEVPAFFFDANVFSNSVQAFNHYLSDPEVLHESTPAEIAWAVYEAELILHDTGLPRTAEWDYEPVIYTAAVLHRDGMIMAPPLLAFAQDELSKLNDKNDGLKLEKVRDAWQSLPKDDLTSRTFSEDSLDIQLAKLAACKLYVDKQADEYREALRELSPP